MSDSYRPSWMSDEDLGQEEQSSVVGTLTNEKQKQEYSHTNEGAPSWLQPTDGPIALPDDKESLSKIAKENQDVLIQEAEESVGILDKIQGMWRQNSEALASVAKSNYDAAIGILDAGAQFGSEMAAMAPGSVAWIQGNKEYEQILESLSPEDQEVYHTLADEMGMPQESRGQPTRAMGGRINEAGEKVSVGGKGVRTSDPENWRRINNLLYIGEREVANAAMVRATEKWSYKAKTEDGAAIYDGVMGSWPMQLADTVLSYVPDKAKEKRSEYEPGTDAYYYWSNMADASVVGQGVALGVTGNAVINKGVNMNRKRRVNKLEKRITKLREKASKIDDPKRKNVYAWEEKRAAEKLGKTLAPDVEDTTKSLQWIRKTIKNFNPSVVALATDANARSLQADMNNMSSLEDVNRVAATKESNRQHLAQAGEDEFGNRADHKKATKEMEAQILKEEREIEKELASIELELRNLSSKHITEGGTDAAQELFYKTLVEFEEGVREKGRRKFEKIPKDAAQIDVGPMLVKMESLLTESGVVASGASSQIKKYIAILQTTARGMRSKSDPEYASLMDLHSVMKKMNDDIRGHVNAYGNSNRGAAIDVIAELLDDIQGESGLFSQYKTKVAQKHLKDLDNAINYWRDEVVNRFDSYPIYSIGKTDKRGKTIVAKPEAINSVLNLMREGNSDVVGLLETALKKDAGSNRKVWKQVYQTLMDDFARAVTVDGVMSPAKVQAYFNNAKNRRPFMYLPGMEDFPTKIQNQLNGLKELELELKDNLKARQHTTLYRALHKNQIFEDPYAMSAKMLRDPAFRSEVLQIAKKTGNEEVVKDMFADYILKQAKQKIDKTDGLVKTGALDPAKLSSILNNPAFEQSLNVILGPKHLFRLRRLQDAWDAEARDTIPRIRSVESEKSASAGEQSIFGFIKNNIASLVSDVNAIHKMPVSKKYVAVRWLVKSSQFVTGKMGGQDVEYLIRRALKDKDALEILEAVAYDKSMGDKHFTTLLKIMRENPDADPVAMIDSSHPMYPKMLKLMTKQGDLVDADDFNSKMGEIYLAATAVDAVTDFQEDNVKNKVKPMSQNKRNNTL